MKHINGNRWQDTIQLIDYLKERIIIGIIIGIVTLGLTILLQNYYWKYAPDLNAAFLVSVLVFLLYIAKDAYKISELRNRMEKADKIYKDIIDGHTGLPHGYSSFMDKIILNDDFKNGIAMININDDNYKELLEDCSKNLEKSYCASFTYPYTIKNIFNPPQEDDISVDDAINFMKTMNRNIANDIKKKRVFIFDKNEFFNELTLVKDKDKLLRFFKVQKDFSLYFIDKSAIQKNVDLHYKFLSVLNADFALFDDALTFRRIGKHELAYYFINNSEETSHSNFKDIFNDKNLRTHKDIFFTLNQTKKKLSETGLSFADLLSAIKADLNIP